MPRYYDPLPLSFSDSPVTVIDEYLIDVTPERASSLVRSVYNGVFYLGLLYNRDYSPMSYLDKVISEMDNLIFEITDDKEYYQTNGLGNIELLPRLASITHFELRRLNPTLSFNIETDNIEDLLRKLIDIKREQIIILIFTKYVYWLLSRDDRFFNLAQQRIHAHTYPSDLYTRYHIGGQEYIQNYKEALYKDLNTVISELAGTNDIEIAKDFKEHLVGWYTTHAGLDATDPGNITSYIHRKAEAIISNYANRIGAMIVWFNTPEEAAQVHTFKQLLISIVALYVMKYVKTANSTGLVNGENEISFPGLADYPLNIRVIQFVMNSIGLDWREEVKAHGVPISDKPILPRVIKGKHIDIEGEGWD